MTDISTMTTATTTSSTKTETSSNGEENYEYDDKPQAAPIELLSEFLSALMLRDYETAFVHCKTILQYEPENQTAVEFFPLIQQRLKEAEEDGSNDGEDSLDDQEMHGSSSDDDDSWASDTSTTSDDEYSTASNTLWTTTGAVTDLESPDKDEVTEELDSAHEDDSTEEALDAALIHGVEAL